MLIADKSQLDNDIMVQSNSNEDQMHLGEIYGYDAKLEIYEDKCVHNYLTPKVFQNLLPKNKTRKIPSGFLGITSIEKNPTPVCTQGSCYMLHIWQSSWLKQALDTNAKQSLLSSINRRPKLWSICATSQITDLRMKCLRRSQESHLKAKCSVLQSFCSEISSGGYIWKLEELTVTRKLLETSCILRGGEPICWLSWLGPQIDTSPLGLDSNIGKDSGGQKRVAQILLDKSLALTIRKIQQSK